MSTNREQFLKKYGLPTSESYSIDELSKISDVPIEILNSVYRRGLGAARSNLSSVRLKDFTKNTDTKSFPASARLSPSQWASARVYSFLNKGKTYYTADADLAAKYFRREKN